MNATTLELTQELSLPELKLSKPHPSLRAPMMALAATAVLFMANAPRRLASALKGESKASVASRPVAHPPTYYPVPLRPIR